MKKPFAFCFLLLLAFDLSPAARRASAQDAVKNVQAPLPAAAVLLRQEGATEMPTARVLKIPAGLNVEVELAYAVSSQEVRKDDRLSFRVVNPVRVNGVVVIAAGATATARVVKASRGGHFGRAGRLAWTMEDVFAVDGTRVPLRFDGRTVGDSKGAKVATQTVLTGVLLGPAAPLALLTGFKRGENANLPAGKRFAVAVGNDIDVSLAAQPH